MQSMRPTSHRLKVMEKRLWRKLGITLGITAACGIFFIFFGLPLISRFILLFGAGKDLEASVQQDKTPLFAPTFNPISEATNSSPIKVSGFSEASAKVRIIVNGKEQKTVDTDNKGLFSADDINLNDGKNTISALVIRDTKESPPAKELMIEYKKTPPKLDITSPEEGARITEEKDMTLNGETDPGNRVTVNDRFVIVDSKGKFSHRVSLSDGENTFKLKATDPAGNQTEKERKVTYSP